VRQQPDLLLDIHQRRRASFSNSFSANRVDERRKLIRSLCADDHRHDARLV
jgi:hypothetical protein